MPHVVWVVAYVLQRAVTDDVVLWSRQSDDRTTLIKRSDGPVKQIIYLTVNTCHAFKWLSLTRTVNATSHSDILLWSLTVCSLFISMLPITTGLKSVHLFKHFAPLPPILGRGATEDETYKTCINITDCFKNSLRRNQCRTHTDGQVICSDELCS